MPVRAVAFDADDTLWDFTTAMNEALEEAIAALRPERSDLAAQLTVVDLASRWDRLHEAFAADHGVGSRVQDLRPQSFIDALGALGAEDPRQVDRMMDAYLAHRHGRIGLYPGTEQLLAGLAPTYAVGLVTNGNTDAEAGRYDRCFHFRLAADEIGIRKPDPRIFAMAAAAAAACRPAELVYVGDHPHTDVAAAQAAGCRAVWVNRAGMACPADVEPDATVADLTQLPAVLARFDAEEAAVSGEVGVGPYPEPWPDDDRLDPALLSAGDRRNVVDRYRYWHEEAIVADLAARAHPFHVAVENWRSDHNIGAVVRNANAFGAAGVHIVGRKRWNRRGAMATDRYLPVHHHESVAGFLAWAESEGLPVVGVDNIAGARPLEGVVLPERCVLLFGQEGPGLSDEARAACSDVVAITQHGSTRSVNAGVASGIAMHAWLRDHAT